MSPICNAQFKVFETKSIHNQALFTLHGLNNKPDVLEEISSEIASQVFRLSLEGHYEETQELRYEKAFNLKVNDWNKSLEEHWKKALEITDDGKLNMLGYSTGATLALLLTLQQKINPHKLVLLAPAIKAKWYTAFIKGLFPFNNFIVPSFSPPYYQANEGTPINLYKSLFHNIEQLENIEVNPALLPETLVVLSEDDELVDSKEVVQWINDNHLSHWKVIWVEKCEDSTVDYSHLLIDSASLGENCFKNLTKKINGFLEK